MESEVACSGGSGGCVRLGTSGITLHIWDGSVYEEFKVPRGSVWIGDELFR